MHDHHLTLPQVWYGLEMEALLALLEARSSRLNPSRAVGFVDRYVSRAIEACRRRLAQDYDFTP